MAEPTPHNSYADPARVSKSVPAYLDEVTRIISTSEIDHRWATRVYREGRQKRLYHSEFVVVTDSTLSLIAESPHSSVDPRPTSMLFFWNNYLWPMHTLSLYWQIPTLNEVTSFRGYFATGSKELELLLEKPIRIILLRGQKCISALNLDLKQVNPEMWKLIDTEIVGHYLREETGAKVFVTSYLEKPTTREQELEYGWARRLDAQVSEAIRYFDSRGDITKENLIVQSSLFAEAFEPGKNPAAELYDTFQELFWERHHDPMVAIEGLHEALVEAPIHQMFVEMIMTCAWFSARGTNRGKQIASIGTGGSITPVTLTHIIPNDALKVFWQRQSFIWPLYYEQLFGLGSIGIDFDRLVRTVPIYDGNIEEGEDFANNLLAEAASLKQWTIPAGAYVQLEIGEIVAVKLHEIGSEVACLLINKEGEYLLVWICPSKQEMSIYGFFEISNAARLQGHDVEWLRKFELGIKLLIAAIIRDFWVIEERERVFGTGRRTKNGPRIPADQGKAVVVYLPRVRYVGDVQNRGDALNLVARRAHFVMGHLRKAVHASETQIQLARRFGIMLPKGFTFVKPHQRGLRAQEVIYRSRSALQCIQALGPISLTGTSDHWFQYELNVKNWLASNGFEVEHLAASRIGDGGVDIQAYRDDEHLLVQCKHWQKEKIGPRIIREMLGTLQTFPEGAHGVIITSTHLTDGAKRLAIQNGIQFIENVDFSERIASKL